MIFIAYFLVRDIPLSFTIDLLCLIKLLLHLDDLHASIFLLSFALYIGVATRIHFLIYMFSQLVCGPRQPIRDCSA